MVWSVVVRIISWVVVAAKGPTWTDLEGEGQRKKIEIAPKTHLRLDVDSERGISGNIARQAGCQRLREVNKPFLIDRHIGLSRGRFVVAGTSDLGKEGGLKRVDKIEGDSGQPPSWLCSLR